MTLKTILALVLCRILASLPHAEGISCYSCLEYPGSNQTCSNPAIIQCGPYYDSCVAMNYTSNIMGIHYSAALKNCSISNHQCNSSYVCGLVNSSISQSGGTLLSCSFNCCYGDLCNGQGGGGNVTLPPWTNPPPTTYHPPFTTQSPSGCGAAVNNTLKSPGYPSRYPNNMDCVYRVHIPHGIILRIVFRSFYLESRYDYLTIKNENNQTFGRYTGLLHGKCVDVTGQYAVLSFQSDGSVTKPGYVLRFYFYRNTTNPPPTTYYPPLTTQNPSGNATNPPPTTYYPPLTTQNPSGCGGVVNNVLKSPRYPLYYPNNMDCNYWVLIPLGYVLNISFSSFVLENSWSCRYDYLKITNELNQTVGKYCGVKTGRNVYVAGRFAVISFHSDGSLGYSGYLLNFSYISNSTSAPPSFTTSYSPYPTVYPTGIPVVTVRPTFGTPGPSPQSRLRYYINVFRALLDQMEYIVDNDLSGNISVREHKDLVRKAIYNVDAAMKSFGRQKRDVMKTKTVDQLKKKANELLGKMENKQSLIKKRSLIKLQGKREAKKQMKKRQLIMKNTMDIVSKSFGKMARNKQ